jgi:hypothetical protein
MTGEGQERDKREHEAKRWTDRGVGASTSARGGADVGS